MKEINISDEMLSKFMEGRTDEVEEARLLQAMEEDGFTAEDLAAIAEAAKLADAAPNQAPNLDLAKRQIAESLRNEDKVKTIPTFKSPKTRVMWAMAASVAIILAVALFILFRPDSNEQNFAQQDESRVETEVKTEKQESETTDKTGLTDKNRKDNISSNTDTEVVQPEQEEVQSTPITPQKLEKNYAKTQIANSLTVTKPNKDNYRVLCKNLEKTLIFEWSVTNVQKLHFTVTDAQGKVLAELTDKTTTHYALVYNKIYPERQLKWKVEAVFEDGTSESKSGQIQIDYQIQ